MPKLTKEQEERFDEKFPLQKPIDWTAYGIKAKPESPVSWMIVYREGLKSHLASELALERERCAEIVRDEFSWVHEDGTGVDQYESALHRILNPNEPHP